MAPSLHTSRHDTLFKQVFTHPEQAAAALRSVLPAKVSASIDWNSLKLTPTEFISALLGTQRADVVFSVDSKDKRPVRLLALLEHQSSEDAWMPLRLLVYIVALWLDFRKRFPKAKKLPSIIPVVIYHGDKPWSAARCLNELVDWPQGLQALLEPYLPQLQLHIDDLTALDDQELTERELPPGAKLALWALKHARDHKRSRSKELGF